LDSLVEDKSWRNNILRSTLFDGGTTILGRDGITKQEVRGTTAVDEQRGNIVSSASVEFKFNFLPTTSRCLQTIATKSRRRWVVGDNMTNGTTMTTILAPSGDITWILSNTTEIGTIFRYQAPLAIPATSRGIRRFVCGAAFWNSA
jgi:hypothetical protein